MAKPRKNKKEVKRFFVKNKKEDGFIVLEVLVILAILFFLSSLLSISENAGGEKASETSEKQVEPAFFSGDSGTRVSMPLPAVDADGKGITTFLKVEATRGTGRTLTDIDNLLFWADTQHSIRIARRVAENITGKAMKDYNIVYTIEANASVIGGPSAGAALALATIAALESREPRSNVMVTGSINRDGSIGPVSSILEKAKAAKEAGAEQFLVPLSQSVEVIYETTESCEVFGGAQICTEEIKPRKIEVANESGIEVLEVESVEEAMKYFF